MTNNKSNIVQVKEKICIYVSSINEHVWHLNYTRIMIKLLRVRD